MTNPITPPELELGLQQILAELKGEPVPMLAPSPAPPPSLAMPPDVLADLFEEDAAEHAHVVDALTAEHANRMLVDLEATGRILIVDDLTTWPSAAAMIAGLGDRLVDGILVPAGSIDELRSKPLEIHPDSLLARVAAMDDGDTDPLPSLAQRRRDPFPGKRVIGVHVRKGKKR